MLTIIGTGHVFNIGDPILFITKQCWPQAVCVELDDMRYHALVGDREALRKDMIAHGIDPDASQEERMKNAPKVYRQSAKYQEKMSSKNKVSAASDMAAAIAGGKSVDAEIFCIDIDAQDAMQRMWDEMSFSERTRYKMSGISDNLFGKRKVDKTQSKYYSDREAQVEEMRRKYPTLVKILIDERNMHMAERIVETARKYERVVAVIGDAHVDGVLKLLPSDISVRTVRLEELVDPVKVKELKTKFWETGEE